MTPGPVPTGYVVHVADGLNPQWTSSAAAAWVMNDIAATVRRYGREVTPARVLSVEAMRGKDEPKSIGGPDPNLPVVWVVHAYGTFVNTFAYSICGQQYFREGWEVFNDTGSPVGEALSNPVGLVASPAPSECAP